MIKYRNSSESVMLKTILYALVVSIFRGDWCILVMGEQGGTILIHTQHTQMRQRDYQEITT